MDYNWQEVERATDTELRKLRDLAIGRMLRLLWDQYRPVDAVSQYETCRAIILHATERLRDAGLPADQPTAGMYDQNGTRHALWRTQR